MSHGDRRHRTWLCGLAFVMALSACGALSEAGPRSQRSPTVNAATSSSPASGSAARSSPLEHGSTVARNHSQEGWTPPRWGPVELVSDESYGGDEPSLTVDIRGRRMIAMWEADTRPANRSGVSLLKVAERVGRTWGEPQVIGRLTNLSGGSRGGAAVALGPHGAVTVVWSQRIAGGDWLVERHREGGRWSALHRLGHGFVMGVVPEPSGDTTVVWSGFGKPIVKSATRRGNRWSEERIVAKRAYDPTMDANDQGSIVVAWAVDTGVAVVTKRSGRDWSSPQTISSKVPYPATVCAALDARSRAVLLWGLDLEEDEPARLYLAWSTTQGNGRWSDPRYFHPGKPNATYGCDVSLNAHGEGVGTWMDLADGIPVATFRFGHGWSKARRMKQGFGPAVWMSDSGTVVLVAADGRWMYRQPDGTWRRGVIDTKWANSRAIDSTGSQFLQVDYGRQITARVLSIGDGPSVPSRVDAGR